MTRQSRRRAAPPELRRAARFARKHGWTVRPARGGHVAWRSPDGEVVRSSSTPGDRQACHRTIADLRRAGLKLPGRNRKKGE